MIDPVLQFLYVWSLGSPLQSASSDGNGGMDISYRSVLLKDATSTGETWMADSYVGDGHWTKHSGIIESELINSFLRKYIK